MTATARHPTNKNMDLTAHVRAHFEDAIALKRQMSVTMAPALARAGEALALALREGRKALNTIVRKLDGKALACGNGGSAAD